MSKVHKTQTMKAILSLGYTGYLQRAVCSHHRNEYQVDLSRLWSQVDCPSCLRLKPKGKKKGRGK